jgi:glycine dehydrogenase
MSQSAAGTFASRHIGPRGDDLAAMLEAVGAASVDALIGEVVPADIRLDRPVELPPAESEAAYLRRLRSIAAKNVVCRSYIGLGYHDTVTPAVIQRNVFENPGWYTPYTPYQAEIAQGRLESLLNFQTMVSDLTGMDVANASLLDEATAAAEAMTLLKRVSKNAAAHVFLVSERIFPQTRDVLTTRATPLGIELRYFDPAAGMPDWSGAFGAYFQTPDDHGAVTDLTATIGAAHEAGVLVAVGVDLLACVLVKPAGEMGADVVIGNSQRFGVPLGFGGPHAAFFATREAFVRQAPGRIIGVSVDAKGRPAYRMALQTREQHIRREKATSNICTAQALLANMAAFYAVFHGPDGLQDIASRVHDQATRLAAAVTALGFTQANAAYFDTLRFTSDATAVAAVRRAALDRHINFHYPAADVVQVSLNETVTDADLQDIVDAFASAHASATTGLAAAGDAARMVSLPAALRRTSGFLAHPVFNRHHSETEMMRYIRGLERKDIGLDTAMIPLGSCTMKLNAAAEMMPVSWPEFGRMHPFVPAEQAAGYHQVFEELEGALRAVTGFAAVSLQPNSGAQGEFAGLLTIHAYHAARGEGHRNVVLIPQSAHGTNPASAAIAGLPVVIVACDDKGNINVDDLRAKAEKHAANLSCLMVTYPSTHGVYETRIREICRIVHEHGGQVYMDGANMNAQVGLTSPASIGADVCHLNLHKTFAIPHGGGGPGMGPIGVAAHLAPFLPGHPVVATGGAQAIHAVSAAPWGSASILLISYGYVRMLGAAGMTASTEAAILNANYLKARLESAFPVLYTGANGRIAHELIFDLRPLKQQSGIDETDVAKRLMDYGFHAPTVSFPVAGTLMVEPTESEPKEELDRFVDAMLAIRAEIQAVIDGTADRADNVLKHAPHTAQDVSADAWSHPYTRESAAYPVPSLRQHKFWPAVARIDNPYGDRNLFCSCPPMDDN